MVWSWYFIEAYGTVVPSLYRDVPLGYSGTPPRVSCLIPIWYIKKKTVVSRFVERERENKHLHIDYIYRMTLEIPLYTDNIGQ